MVLLQLKGLDLLAGRKLLLADDSVTIQKVIDLTFADEGVRVVTFSNGQEAIDNLEQVAPDIVLADVFMPLKSGYQLCEYIKTNEKLKHIPVMLLVGSFEPFDEEEARRVGADDTLTKPFQSIRRLIDRVGSLIGNQPSEQETPTAELRTEKPRVEEERLSTKELELTTADTLQLSGTPKQAELTEDSGESFTAKAKADEKIKTAVSESSMDSQLESDGLLDLGDLEPRSVGDDDFVLDLGMEDSFSNYNSQAAPLKAVAETSSNSDAASATKTALYADERPADFAPFAEQQSSYEDNSRRLDPVASPDRGFESSFRSTQESHTGSSSASLPDNLSPAMIDAIARRAVELMSEKVIREIAWEVVPELAELMIKRQLEESQPK